MHTHLRSNMFDCCGQTDYSGPKVSSEQTYNFCGGRYFLFPPLSFSLLFLSYSELIAFLPVEVQKKTVEVTLVGLEETISTLKGYLMYPNGVLLCGIAGVGKSTLTKHILSDPKVIERRGEWRERADSHLVLL